MDEDIRILLVDDDRDLLETAAEVLETRHDHFDVLTTTSPNTALSRLKDRRVDCVVADYQMPEMDGLELLNKVRVMEPDLPFIIYTGRGSEDVAGQAISAGVTDYLRKRGGEGTFDLLANRIQNAVDNYRNERALEATRTRFRLLVEESTDAIFVVAEDGTIKWVNPVTNRLLGIAPEQFAGTSAFKFVHPDDLERIQAQFAELLENPDSRVRSQFRVKHVDGGYVSVEARVRNLIDHPVIGGIVAYLRAADPGAELFDSAEPTTADVAGGSGSR